MMDKNYYTTKQQNLQQKLAKIKDQYIVDALNMAQRLSEEIREIQNESQEITEIINKESKETNIPIKKKGK